MPVGCNHRYKSLDIAYLLITIDFNQFIGGQKKDSQNMIYDCKYIICNVIIRIWYHSYACFYPKLYSILIMFKAKCSRVRWQQGYYLQISRKSSILSVLKRFPQVPPVNFGRLVPMGIFYLTPKIEEMQYLVFHIYGRE